LPERGEEGRERFGISERCVRAEELESAGLIGRDQHLCKTRRRNNRDSTRTANKKLGLQAIHLVPSSDSPPPGTMMCTCGRCVITEPQHGGYAERAAARSTTINQPTTNSLLTRKFTGNFKNPFMRNQGVSWPPRLRRMSEVL
jgi:hypothetical protein